MTTNNGPGEPAPSRGWYAVFPCGCPSPIVYRKHEVRRLCYTHNRKAKAVVSVHETRTRTEAAKAGRLLPPVPVPVEPPEADDVAAEDADSPDGKAFRGLRLSEHMTHSEVAEAMGLQAFEVRRIERQGLRKLRAMIEELGLDFADLIGAGSKPVRSPQLPGVPVQPVAE